MGILKVEPLVHGELLSTKLTVKVSDFEGNYKNDNVLKVLLNCGWSLDFDEEKLNLYKKQVEDVDVVLITDGDFSHSGALLWLVSRFLSNVPGTHYPRVLCTEGTYKFIRASLIDVLENVTFTSNFDYYNVEDLEVFNKNCVKLRYHETYCFTKKFENLEVKTSFRAVNNGFSVGGAIWTFSVGFNTIVCGDKIRVYPSTLLNGTNLKDIFRPDLLILSQHNSETPNHVSNPRDVEVCQDLNNLVEKLVETLTNGGNVLIPMDVDSTLINLLVHLNMMWSTSHLSQFKIVLASPIADKLLLLIGTCLEYMKTSIFHNFIKTLWNPLMDLCHVDFITSLDQLAKYRFRPTVFISTCSNVTFGFSNFLFVAIASYYKNLVVLTSKNASVTRYLSNYNFQDKQLPQYRLQINLKYNKYQQDNLNDESDEKQNDENYYQKFSGQNNFGTVSSNQNVDLDAKTALDYGLPFNDLLADPSNPYGFGMFPKYEDNIEDIEYVYSTEENTQLDDYFRKYIDDSKNNLFDIDSESSLDPQPKTDLLTKKFPFLVKSQVCLAKCFSNLEDEKQLPSLLYRICPRNVVLLPDSESGLNCDDYLNKLLRCSLHSFHKNKDLATKGQTKKSEDYSKIEPSITVDLNLLNYPVLLNDRLLLLVRNHFNRGPPAETFRNSGTRSIESVVNSIKLWKFKNNGQSVCQVVSTLKNSEESQKEITTHPDVIHCHTFWSDESRRHSGLEFTFKDSENFDSQDKSGHPKMGLDSTLFVGDINMSTYSHFVDECLPNSVSIISGSAVINDRVMVSKHSNYDSNEWVIDATLDPSYYLARKLLRKLHNTIEPIY